MEPTVQLPFGPLLKRHRAAAGLTQEELAARAGLSSRAVLYLESGTRTPYRQPVRRLAEALALAEEERTRFEAAARRWPPAPTSPASGGAKPAAPVPAAVPAGDRALRVVGREREQGLLRTALSAALGGAGSLVLIGGEAGIGKTALAVALCQEGVQQGARHLVGRCFDLTETPPYGAWSDVLAGLPALAGTAGQPGDAAQVRTALADAAGQHPLMLLLDDLQWADPASLELLRLVGRGLAALPMLLLVTYRSDELTRRHPLAHLLPVLVHEAPTLRLDLRPLTEEGVRTLVEDRYALPARDVARLVTYLRGRAEGNPFFSGEVLRALEEEGVLRRTEQGWTLGALGAARVPVLLRQVVENRLQRLGEKSRDVLQIAAVVGQEVALAPWAEVAGVGEDALLPIVERAVEAGVLEATPDGRGVRFAHALIREALYEGLLPPRRRSWHRRVGEALTAGRLPADPDVVAYHFQQAGDARAGQWLVAAGERAQRARAWLTAAARFDAALALLDEDAAHLSERGWGTLLHRQPCPLPLGCPRARWRCCGCWPKG
jgi:predicted ATPase/transcriptional regulator with XRE-family HTH domain